MGIPEIVKQSGEGGVVPPQCTMTVTTNRKNRVYCESETVF